MTETRSEHKAWHATRALDTGKKEIRGPRHRTLVGRRTLWTVAHPRRRNNDQRLRCFGAIQA